MDVYDEVDRRETDAGETLCNEIKQVWIVIVHTKFQSKHMFCSSASVFSNYCWGEFLCLALPEGDVNWKESCVFHWVENPLGKSFPLNWLCLCLKLQSFIWQRNTVKQCRKVIPSSLFFSSGTVWLATQNHSTLVTETTVVPFLPVNPEYSSTRNQVWNLNTVKNNITTQIIK